LEIACNLNWNNGAGLLKKRRTQKQNFCRIFGLKSPFVRENLKNFQQNPDFLHLLLDIAEGSGIEYENLSKYIIWTCKKEEE